MFLVTTVLFPVSLVLQALGLDPFSTVGKK
jgi:hypothetical protein